jgi:hypothetical protein
MNFADNLPSDDFSVAYLLGQVAAIAGEAYGKINFNSTDAEVNQAFDTAADKVRALGAEVAGRLEAIYAGAGLPVPQAVMNGLAADIADALTHVLHMPAGVSQPAPSPTSQDRGESSTEPAGAQNTTAGSDDADASGTTGGGDLSDIGSDGTGDGNSGSAGTQGTAGD